jgi:hypothetical protein
VLVGHYDSTSGPAVFFRLGSVLPGDRVQVVGASGATVTFVVDRLQEVAKATFPVSEVYGPVTRPEIRLITCDGAFDESTHHYVDNLVVYGHALSPAEAASPPTAARASVSPSPSGSAGSPSRSVSPRPAAPRPAPSPATTGA